MQDKIIFREMLSEIKALADSKGNKLTKAEVQEFFSNAHLEEEQMELIYQYLLGQKIQVEGFAGSAEAEKVLGKEETAEENAEEEAPTEEDVDDYTAMYLEDLESVAELAEEEIFALFQKTVAGDAEAKSRLIEQHLRLVYDISHTYLGQGLPQGDLIQEGNIGLVMAMEVLTECVTLEEYRLKLYEAVSSAMESALGEQQDMRDMDEEIAERVNHLSQAVKNLEEDLEHKVSLEELSAYLEMPIEELKDVLRMAGDEIEIEGHHNHEGEEHHHHGN